MLNTSFLTCTKVDLWDLTVCIAVNGKTFRSHTLTLVRQCPISNLSESFSYTTIYLNFMFLDQCLLELSCKKTHGNTHTHTDAHKDSDECSIVAFCKNATITLLCKVVNDFCKLDTCTLLFLIKPDYQIEESIAQSKNKLLIHNSKWKQYKF